MLRGIDATKAGMIGILEYNDNIAHSLANANTVAFKQTNLSFKNIHDTAINAVKNGRYNLENNGSIGSLSQGSVVDSHTIDFTQGAVKDTGRNLDFAIDGEGFFKIRMDDGSSAYTRNGVFNIINDGTLVDLQGRPVMNKDGIVKIPATITVEDKQVPVDFSKLLVRTNGEIYYDKKLCSKIDLYDFEDKSKVMDLGENKFISMDEENNPAVLEANPNIRQGALEMSNANSILSLINSMNAQRAYESMSNVMQTNSTTLQKAISSVGKVAE